MFPRKIEPMTSESETEHRPSTLNRAFAPLMHQLIGTIGVLFLAALLTTLVFELPSPWGRMLAGHDVAHVLTEIPYFPVQIVVGLLLGWAISDAFEHRSMLWIWVLPYAWLLYSFARLSPVLRMPFQERLSYFFGRGCRPENGCVSQVGITLPFYAAVAYSIGALLQRDALICSPIARKKVSATIFIVGVIVVAEMVIPVVFEFKYVLDLAGPGRGWILVPALALGTGTGAGLIFLALKMKRLDRRLRPTSCL